MAKTPFGRHVTMIGGNAVATFRAGIKVDRLVLITFMLAGAIAGLAGWLLAIRTSGATANLGIGMLFNAFAAVVIGGVSLKGGVGQLPGVYAGVLLLSSIHTAINLMGLPAHYTQMILGGLVLAAVLLDTVKLPDPAEARMTGRLDRTAAPSSSARRAASAPASPSASSRKARKVVIADTEAEAGAGHRRTPRRALRRHRHRAEGRCGARRRATRVDGTWRARHPGAECRHLSLDADREYRARGMGQGAGRQSQGHLSRGARRAARHEGTEIRPHGLHLLDHRPARHQPRPWPLFGEQGRHQRLHQGGGA